MWPDQRSNTQPRNDVDSCYEPAGMWLVLKQHRCNVNATYTRRITVKTTLFQRVWLIAPAAEKIK